MSNIRETLLADLAAITVERDMLRNAMAIQRSNKEMTNFRITWTIDIEAESPEEAVVMAFVCMQAPTTATFYKVSDPITGEVIVEQDFEEVLSNQELLA